MSGTRATGVRYGRPAIEVLAGQVRAAKAGDPLAPVTVVVPSNYAAVAARRALAAEPGGIANVTFLTLHRLAEHLGRSALAAQDRLPVSAPLTAAAVRAVLAEEPGVFEPVAEHAATEAALVRVHRELRTVPDDALERLADGGRPRTVDARHRPPPPRLSAAGADLLRALADVSDEADDAWRSSRWGYLWRVRP